MLKYEKQVREMFERISRVAPTTRDELRLRYHEQKLANLKRYYRRLRIYEPRVLRLMSRVDYSDIKPRLILAQGKDSDAWNYCRHIISSFIYNGRLGRQQRYFCVDDNTGGILGVLEICSDLNILGPRDKYIGWTKQQKYDKRRLNNVVNVGTCVCVQPFGTLTGGKFMIVAALSDVVHRKWFARYQQPFVAVTTTSLYGKSSIYNRIKEYKYLGTTPGVGISNFSQSDVDLMRKFCAANELVGRQGMRGGSFIKFDAANKIAAALKINRAESGVKAPKGVYVAADDDALNFLRCETDRYNAKPKPIEEIADFWLHRWYEMRWPKKCEEINAFDVRIYSLDAQITDIEKRVEMAA